MRKLLSLTFILLMGMMFSNLQAQTKKAAVYGGVKTCKACHMTKKSGAQYKIWKASKHAKAFETLKGEEALAIAKKKGIADPSKSDKCLKCHVTAFGVDAKLKGPKLTMEEGISCEACHGAGSNYKSRKTMKAITAGTLKPADYGLTLPDEKSCVTCHNEESPKYKKFVFKEMVAKIAHPIPKK